MKWRFLIILAAVIAVLVTAFVLQPDSSVASGLFQPRLRDTLQHGGFTLVAQASGSGDQVPLPLTIQWHPRRWHSERSFQATIGFPDGADHFTVTRDGSSMIECFVRYLDARAQLIEIRAGGSQTVAASELRSTLGQQFPGLPIKLRIQ